MQICFRDFKAHFPEEVEFIAKCTEANFEDGVVIVVQDGKPPSVLVDDKEQILCFK